jgi:hypothetical protein
MKEATQNMHARGFWIGSTAVLKKSDHPLVQKGLKKNRREARWRKQEGNKRRNGICTNVRRANIFNVDTFLTREDRVS